MYEESAILPFKYGENPHIGAISLLPSIEITKSGLKYEID